MTGDSHQPPPPAEPELPPRLLADLSRLYRLDVPVPPALDEAILRAGRAGVARRLRFRRLLRLGGAGAAAAALLLLAVGIFRARQEGSAPVAVQAPPASPSRVAEDIDGSGRVDILDAFVVAKALDLGKTTQPAWDLDGDGAVDRQDVQRIASAAVDVSGSGGAIQ